MRFEIFDCRNSKVEYFNNFFITAPDGYLHHNGEIKTLAWYGTEDRGAWYNTIDDAWTVITKHFQKVRAIIRVKTD